VTGILRQAADRSGVGALTLIANRAEDKGRFVEQGFDALIDPPPDQWHSCQPSNHATGLDFLEVLGGLRDSTDYLDRYFAYLDFTVSRMLNRSQRGRVLPRVFPAFHDWLAHPGGGATQLVNRSNRPADAQLYGMFLENAMLFTERHFPAGDQVVFLHSWNKWQDGSQIEPSQWDGDMLWNATRDAIDRGRYQIKCKSNVMPAQNAARRDTIAMMCDAARQTLKQT